MEPAHTITDSETPASVGPDDGREVGSAEDAFRFICVSARTHLDVEALSYIDATIDQINWPQTLGIARFHRLVSLMHWSLSRSFPDRIPEVERAYLAESFRQSAIFNLAFADELSTLCTALEDAGIRCIGFKGPPFAQMAYGNLGLRPCTDADVLVPMEAFDRVQELLEARGYWLAKHIRDLRGASRERFLNLSGQAAFVRGSAGSVDIHLAVMPPGYRFDESFEALYERSQVIPVGAARLRTFAPEDQLLVMCFHGVKNRWELLRHVVDVAELARSQEDLDWRAAIERAKRSRAERIIRIGLELAAVFSGLELDDEVTSWIRRDRRVARLVPSISEILAHSHVRTSSAGQRFRFHLDVQETMGTKARYLGYVLRRRRYNWSGAGAE